MARPPCRCALASSPASELETDCINTGGWKKKTRGSSKKSPKTFPWCLRLASACTWPLERLWRSAFDQKKGQKCCRIAPVASTRAINQRPGGRAGERRQRQAGGRGAAQNPARFFFQLPAVSRPLLSPFYDFPEHYQSSWHEEGCVFFLSVCICMRAAAVSVRAS